MCYFIASEYTISNLIAKKKKNGKLPKTELKEIVKLDKFIFKKLKGRCILEHSSDSFFSAALKFNNLFSYDSENETVSLSNAINVSEDYIEREFKLPQEINIAFDAFLREA